MKIYRDIEQGSEEWTTLRKGRPTASGFDAIVTTTGLSSKQRDGYMRELIAECFCPDFAAWGGNAATQRGTEVECEAREVFKTQSALTIEQVGFVLADDGVCGCSPDSLILDAEGKPVAGLEIKCPSPKVHVGYVLDDMLPPEYKQQVHGSMAVTGLRQWHFWSYFPGMQPFHKIALWDDYTDKMVAALKFFVADYKEMTAQAIPKLKLSGKQEATV